MPLLLLLCAAQFMVILDITVVNVALPSIQRELGIPFGDLQWVITAYTLAFGGLLLLGGRVADLFGRRRAFVAGVAAFVAASLGAALAESAAALIAARVGQGASAALLSPAALALVTTSFPEGPERRRALAAWAGVAASGGAFGVLVGGRTAEFVDQKASLAAHLPLAVLLVVGTTFVVLFLMTGSVVLPLKAAVMNVLTLSATLGALVLVFQDGRLEGLLGYTSQGGLDATQPLFLAIVAFGLSTDYAVFLLSRIKEARDGGLPDDEAVAVGLERTGRIVTAAALLFAVAIGAFVTSQIVFIKELGLGTALAVLVDATIIRALLVPSLMKLLGWRNWWAPAPLRRFPARFGMSEAA